MYIHLGKPYSLQQGTTTLITASFAHREQVATAEHTFMVSLRTILWFTHEHFLLSLSKRRHTHPFTLFHHHSFFLYGVQAKQSNGFRDDLSWFFQVGGKGEPL